LGRSAFTAPMLSRLPALAVVCGAALFGWSLGGVSSVDRQLTQTRESQPHFVSEHASPCHGHHDRGEV
jgi:hypothetical protein